MEESGGGARLNKEKRIWRMVLEETIGNSSKRVSAGSAEGFRALFERHKDKVYSIALRYSGDESTAMDHRAGTRSSSCTPRSAAFAVSRLSNRGCTGSWSIAASTGKRRERRLMPLVTDARCPAGTGDMTEAAVRRVEPARASWWRGCRRAAHRIVLRYTQGMSYDEIAGFWDVRPERWPRV